MGACANLKPVTLYKRNYILEIIRMDNQCNFFRIRVITTLRACLG